MEKKREELKLLFRDGARPIGQDFADLIDSSPNKADDVISNDLVLGSFADTPQSGAMRFEGGKVQVFDGGWKDISGGNTFFTLVGTSDIQYSAGKVGIGFTAGAALTQILEVGNPGVTTTQMARLGRALVGQLQGLGAMFSHQDHGTATNYAVGQLSNGETKVNAAAAGTVTLNIGNQSALAITTNRETVIGKGVTSILTLNPPAQPGHPNGAVDLVLHVQGDAIKSSGGSSWATGSDERLKKDIHGFHDGLPEIRKVRTVKFKYNGKCGTTNGREQIGIIGQEMEQVFPYMVWKAKGRLEENAPEAEDIRIFDSSPLIFVLVNAIKELDAKVQSLEKSARHEQVN